MSVMCKMGSTCSTKRGLCVHEKVMLGMLTVVIIVSLVIKIG